MNDIGVWLNLRNPVSTQLRPHLPGKPHRLRLEVKFYVAPQELQQEETRWANLAFVLCTFESLHVLFVLKLNMLGFYREVATACHCIARTTIISKCFWSCRFFTLMNNQVTNFSTENTILWLLDNSFTSVSRSKWPTENSIWHKITLFSFVLSWPRWSMEITQTCLESTHSFFHLGAEKTWTQK